MVTLKNVAVCLLVAVLVACSARAQELADRPLVGAGLTVVFDDVASVAGVPLGETAVGVAAEFGAFGGTLRAWDELGAALGYGPGGAVRALLDGRAVVHARDADRWVAVLDVRDEVATRVATRLDASPRGLVRGRPVLTLESGRVRLVVVERTGPRSRLALASGAANELLGDVVRAAEGSGSDRPLASGLARSMVLGLGDGVGDGERRVARAWSGSGFEAAVVRTAGGVRVELLGEPAAFGLSSLPAPGDCWDDGSFRDVIAGASVAVVRSGGAGSAAWPGGLIDLFVPSDLVRAVGPTAGDRRVAAAFDAEMGVRLLVEGGGVEGDAGPVHDLLVRLTLDSLPGVSNDDEAVASLGGRYPGAVRKAPLRVEPDSPIAPYVGLRPVASWGPAGEDWWRLDIEPSDAGSGAGRAGGATRSCGPSLGVISGGVVDLAVSGLAEAGVLSWRLDVLRAPAGGEPGRVGAVFELGGAGASER